MSLTFEWTEQESRQWVQNIYVKKPNVSRKDYDDGMYEYGYVQLDRAPL